MMTVLLTLITKVTRSYKGFRPVVAMTAGLALCQSAAAEDIVIGNHAARPGDNVRVPVLLPDAAGFASVAVTINYDAELLALEGMTNGPLGSLFALEYGIEEGRVGVAAVREEALASGGGALVVLNFRVNSGAVPGLNSALTIADRGAAAEYGRDLAWTRPVTSANGILTVVSTTLDSDANGLPDWWEEKFFGSPSGATASGDPDGDGLTTVQEYIAGTDPLNASSGLRLELQWAADAVRLRLTTVEGKRYRIERTDNLETWHQIRSDIEGTGALAEVIDPTPASVQSAFYRLVIIR